MVINVSEKSYIKAGIKQQSKGNYIDALCLFARTNTYEGVLNAIMCLCQNGNNAYATDLYRIAKARFERTHALVPDLFTYGGPHVAMMLLCCEEKQKLEREYYNEKSHLVHADESLVTSYKFEENLEELENFLMSDLPALDYSVDSSFSGENPCFFEVGSVEYLDYLRNNIKLAYMNGDVKLAEKITKRYLSLPAKDATNLETQLTLALYGEHYRKASAIAKNVAELDEPTVGTLWRSIEAVHCAGVRDKDLIYKLIYKCLPFLEEHTELFDLDDMMELASLRLGDEELACTLALHVARQPNLCSLATLKCAVITLFNNCQAEQARLLAVKLYGAVGFDDAVFALWNYVCNADTATEKLDYASGPARHVHVPFAVMESAENRLVEKAKANQNFTAEDYRLLGTLISFCKAMFTAGRTNVALTASTLVRTLILTTNAENKQDFFEFAFKQLSSVCSDVALQEAMIRRLFTLRCEQPFLVNLTDSCYWLDLSDVLDVDDGFADVFSVVSAVHAVKKADLPKIRHFYEVFKQYQLPEKETYSVDCVAYAVLCSVYDDFLGSTAEGFFDDQTKLLYNFHASTKPEELV